MSQHGRQIVFLIVAWFQYWISILSTIYLYFNTRTVTTVTYSNTITICTVTCFNTTTICTVTCFNAITVSTVSYFSAITDHTTTVFQVPNWQHGSCILTALQKHLTLKDIPFQGLKIPYEIYFSFWIRQLTVTDGLESFLRLPVYVLRKAIDIKLRAFLALLYRNSVFSFTVPDTRAVGSWWRFNEWIGECCGVWMNRSGCARPVANEQCCKEDLTRILAYKSTVSPWTRTRKLWIRDMNCQKWNDDVGVGNTVS